MSKFVLCLLACLLFVGSVGLPVPGAAQAGAIVTSSDVEARSAFEEGTAAYDLGRFEEARIAFERAYALSPRPKLLFNIGRSAEGDAQYARALSAYEGYLAALPGAENRPFVESRIAKLRTLVPAAAVPTAPPTVPTPLPATQLPVDVAPVGMAPVAAASAPHEAERPARSRKRAWLWGIAGAVVLGAGVGTVVALTRKSDGSSEAGELIMTLRHR